MESANVLIIGDPHFKVTNTKETDAMVTSILQIAIERQPDFIVVLGDILDRHESIHVSPLTRAISFFSKLIEIAPVYVLIGNHDLKNNRQFLSPEHPFTALKFWNDRIIIVDTVIKRVIKGHLFVFVPYTPPGRFHEALNYCSGWEQAHCIFAHQEFKGAHMGAVISVEGDEWSLKAPQVISGHIHDYHRLQENILYIGTPIQHAFGDRPDKTISYIVFTGDKYFEERINLGVPRKFIVRLSCDEVTKYIPEPNSEINSSLVAPLVN